MRFWPFKKIASHSYRTGEFNHLVWETNTLAKVALVPFVEHYPQYEPIVESSLMEAWNRLLTIAMTGVAAHTRNMLSDPQARKELKRSLDEWWEGGGVGFEDYYEYTSLRTAKVEAPWAGVSAMWVVDNLRLHSKANEALKRNGSELNFINPLAAFMKLSFGSTEVGFPHYIGSMALEAEKELGIDMGLGTKGTKQDSTKKLQVLVEIFQSYARNTVDLIAKQDP